VFCNNCGQQLPPASKFCNFCGANLTQAGAVHHQPDEHPATRAQSEIEQVIFTAQPTMLFVYARYIAAGIFTLIVIVIAAIVHSRFNLALAPFVAIALGLIAFLNPVYHHILRQRESYTLTTDKIEFSYGLLARTTRNIPLTKIQDVTSSATALERVFGIGDVIIDSAAEMGKIALRKVHNPKAVADRILQQLRQQQ
jgi:membrane protein YdbS with pleckstrin-like domain